MGCGGASSPRRGRRSRQLDVLGLDGGRRLRRGGTEDPLQELLVLRRGVERHRPSREGLGLVRPLWARAGRARLRPRARRCGCPAARPPSGWRSPGRSSWDSSARPGTGRSETRRCPARSEPPHAASGRRGGSPSPRSTGARAEVLRGELLPGLRVRRRLAPSATRPGPRRGSGRTAPACRGRTASRRTLFMRSKTAFSSFSKLPEVLPMAKVRVKEAAALEVGLRDLLGRRIARDPEQLVVREPVDAAIGVLHELGVAGRPFRRLGGDLDVQAVETAPAARRPLDAFPLPLDDAARNEAVEDLGRGGPARSRRSSAASPCRGCRRSARADRPPEAPAAGTGSATSGRSRGSGPGGRPRGAHGRRRFPAGAGCLRR